MSHGTIHTGLGRATGWRRLAAALGVLALLSQTLVLLIHRPPAAAPVDMAMAMTMGPDCPMIMGDADAAPSAPADTDKAPRKRAPVCPICQSLHLSSVFVSAVQPVALAALSVVAVIGLTLDSRPPVTATNERARSRAPPTIERPSITTLDG
ncbi:MAG: hypothetical protein HY060_16625 [Proteobacteria bacterium]|nr:hypothetical protein [Pseudomonadota bacterium]